MSARSIVSAFAIVPILALSPAFLRAQTLGEALDAPELVWQTSRDFPWTPYGTGAQSGHFDYYNQVSWLETYVEGAGVVSFRWQHPDADSALRFFVDGQWQAETRGQGAWSWVDIAITTPGSHTLRWETRSEDHSNVGSLDEVSWFSGAASGPRRAHTRPCDFDGDGVSDPATYDPVTSTFHYLASSTGTARAQQWGVRGDIPVPGNYDGGSSDNFAVFRPSSGEWFVRLDDGSIMQRYLGAPESRPVPADYDGDGITDMAIVDPATYEWTIFLSNSGQMTQVQFGTLDAIPVPGNYDGVPGAEVAIYWEQNHTWYWQTVSGSNSGSKAFGWTGRIPCPADFDGDGVDDWATYDPNSQDWHIKINGGPRADELGFGLGVGDIPAPGDYDGDGTGDVAFVQSSTGRWFVKQSSTGRLMSAPPVSFGWAPSGDIPVPAGYTTRGANSCNIAVYRPESTTWFIRGLRDGEPTTRHVWGTTSSYPIRGDFDGDGFDDVACIDSRDYVWRIKTSGAGPNLIQPFGWHGDWAVPGDYDGDGIADIAVYRPSDGSRSSRWFIKGSNDGRMDQDYGWVDDQPVPADYDSDGITDIAVFRPSTGVWFVKLSGGGWITQSFGWTGDIPLPADYDADGVLDLAVFRPSNGMWYIRTAWGRMDRSWGQQGDVPVPGDYDLDGVIDLAVYRNGEWHIRESSTGRKMEAPGAFHLGLPSDTIIGGCTAP